MKQCAFHALLASLLSEGVRELRALKHAQVLTQWMLAAKCIKDGQADVRQFVAHCYQPQDNDLSLDDPHWDLQLSEQLIQALQLETEVVWHS